MHGDIMWTTSRKDVKKRKKLLFIVTEDWFFASHFMPMAKVGIEDGLEVVVVTRVRTHAFILESLGTRVIPFEANRRSMNPIAAVRDVVRLALILRREQPTIVHCISLKSILLGGMAATVSRIPCRVFAFTGLGFLGAAQKDTARAGRRLTRLLLNPLFTSRQTHYLFENGSDPYFLGLAPDGSNVTLVGGAGIDPDAYKLGVQLAPQPLRVAIVSRMLWSKGIDIAVDAIRICRRAGHDVRLSLYGLPDRSNPKAFSEEQLRHWASEDGIEWHGQTRHVSTVWATHHLACLPSRGGEGLPRTILEAAACGRAIVTTEVPGCRDFVRHNVDGILVPPGDAARLAEAFSELALAPHKVKRMGASARNRVLSGYTERDVADRVRRIYRNMLAEH